MITRAITKVLEKSARQYPVVTVLGPRQSGKTTLAKSTFPEYAYANLEDPELRLLARNDPKEFLERFAAPVIIDEVQRVPELLSYIQVRVDETPDAKGSYVLTGSQQLNLRATITQSLAGRTALLKLLPLALTELAAAGISRTRDEYIFEGFMPRHYNEDLDPVSLYRNYYETYVERDVSQLLSLRNRPAFELFLKLLAGRIGQVVNLHALSGEVGVSSTTLKEWVSVLEASFVVFRLPPYFENFGKRFIKSPKLYFTEIGLAAYLLEIRSSSHVARDPLLGNLFENMVVIEALKARYNSGCDADMYFFRDQSGFEVDLVKSEHRQLTPIEIKAARTFSPDFISALKKFSALSDRVTDGAVIYAGDQEQKYKGCRLLRFTNTGSLFQSETQF